MPGLFDFQLARYMDPRQNNHQGSLGQIPPSLMPFQLTGFERKHVYPAGPLHRQLSFTTDIEPKKMP